MRNEEMGMRTATVILSAAVLMLPGAIAVRTQGQGQPPTATPPAAPPAPQQPPGGRGRGRGGDLEQEAPRANFPQQQRKAGDPAVIERGKGIYQSICAACHGIDLRGGQQGGPNLLRSQIVLQDKEGELIAPIVQNGRPTPVLGTIPMPPIPLQPDDVKAVAEYLHSVLAQAERQGRPPEEGKPVAPERVLVGDAAAGQAYFASHCSSCHSVTGDLQGLASRVADPRELQNLWVSGGGGRGRGRGGRGAGGHTATVTVTPANGASVQGHLARLDDFTVSVILDDGTRRTFARNGSDPKIDINDPADAHRKLVPTLSDTDMHNITAYLWSLK
jgi:cytochrome c oxidase cbb3-type subunit III